MVRQGEERIDRDCQLVSALSSGQPGAPEELLGAYGDRAYRLALRITRNTADAEEVVHDAFCAIVRKIDAFRRQSGSAGALAARPQLQLRSSTPSGQAMRAALSSMEPS